MPHKISTFEVSLFNSFFGGVGGGGIMPNLQIVSLGLLNLHFGYKANTCKKVYPTVTYTSAEFRVWLQRNVNTSKKVYPTQSPISQMSTALRRQLSQLGAK